jgi:hypothetical protein
MSDYANVEISSVMILEAFRDSQQNALLYKGFLYGMKFLDARCVD